MNTTIPVDLLPDIVKPGLPVWMSWHRDDETPYRVDGFVLSTHEAIDGTRVIWYCDDPAIGCDNRGSVFLHLDTTLPSVAWGVCVVLTAGVECPRPGCAEYAVPGCEACHGTGFTRKPTPSFQLLPKALGGTLRDDFTPHSPALVAEHARRVAAGMPGIKCVERTGPTDHAWDNQLAAWLSHGTAVVVDGTLRLPS